MNIDSILHQYKQTYFNLPKPIKHFLGELYGNVPLSVRFGPNYSKHKNILDKFQNASTEFQMEYMFNKTAETLHFAYDNIPYYRQIFKDYSFEPKKFQSFEDLKKLPYIDKETIIKNIDNLYTDKFDKPVQIQTGGSTRLPMKFYVPLKESRAKEKVYFLDSFYKTGYKYRDNAIGLRDKYYADDKNSIYWAYEKVDNYLMISGSHINEKFIETILAEIRKYKPKFIYAYPSAVYLFIKTCRSIGIEHWNGIKGIILTSETIPESYISYFKDFFNCTIVSHYGHSERVLSAYKIDKDPYCFYNSYGLTEVINKELVGTSFDNFVMPFINYQTKDFVNGKIEFYPHSKIIKTAEYIDGRLQEYVITKNKELICITQLSTEGILYLDYIDAIQFRQDKIGHLTLLIKTNHKEKINKQEVLNTAIESVHELFEFDIEFVDKIRKTPSGKWIYCIQNLDVSNYK